MSRDVFVVGAGMIPFKKPGAGDTYSVMAATAIREALSDAKLSYDQIEHAYAGYAYGDTCSGQRAIYDVGATAIPVFNVNNACATGSSALYLARQAVASGQVECALAVGFEQMNPGALGTMFDDRPSVYDHFDTCIESKLDVTNIPLAMRLFGSAGLEHMKRFGTKLEPFAKIRAKASRHASNNPLALFKKVVTEEEVMASPVLWPGVMTRLMACPPTCGAAAAIVTSADFAKRHNLRSEVKIAAQAITTDSASTFDNNDLRGVAGYYMAQTAAKKVYEAAGIGPEDIDVIELHDCFAQNELLTYESLGLCAEGEAEKLVLDGDNTYGGKYVTNPSGGLLSKGHPIGATGLAQCFELVNQLRGEAEARQVPNARLALQHNIGIGGACVVTLYERV